MKAWLYDDGGSQVLRVVHNNADNPAALAVTDYGKFIFDGLNPNQLDLSYSETYQANHFSGSGPTYESVNPGAAVPSNFYYYHWPSGTNSATCTHLVNQSQVLVNINRVPEEKNITSVQAVDGSGWRYYDDIEFTSGGAGTGSAWSRWINSSHVIGGLKKIPYSTSLWYGEWHKQIGLVGQKYSSLNWGLPFEKGQYYSTPTGAPAVGKVLARITNKGFRVAHSGFDVRTATRDQMMITSGKNIAQLVKSGTVYVANNATVSIPLPSGIVYDESVFIQLVALTSGYNYTYPLIDSYFNLYGQNSIRKGSQARISGSNLEIKNETLNARTYLYMVISSHVTDDDFVATGTQAVRTVEAGGERYIQFNRLGASTPPKLSDVLFDSRFPRISLVAQGEWSIPSPSVESGTLQAVKTHTVNFTNLGGWVPFPIWICETHIPPSGDQTLVKKGGPQVQYFTQENSVNVSRYGGDTTFANVTSTSVTFNSYAGHYEYPGLDGGGFSNYRPFNHLKYYILAIQI